MRVGDFVPVFHMTTSINYEEEIINILVSTRGDVLSTWADHSLKEGKIADNTLNDDVKSNSFAALGSTTLPGRVFEDDVHIHVSTRLICDA